jgi:Ca2+-binding RTX toxin-like protein
LNEVRAWQSRPLGAIYLIVFFDCLVVKVRHDKRINNKPVWAPGAGGHFDRTMMDRAIKSYTQYVQDHPEFAHESGFVYQPKYKEQASVNKEGSADKSSIPHDFSEYYPGLAGLANTIFTTTASSAGNPTNNNQGPGPRRRDDNNNEQNNDGPRVGKFKGPGDSGDNNPPPNGPHNGPKAPSGDSGNGNSFNYINHLYNSPIFTSYKPSYMSSPLFSQPSFTKSNYIYEPSWLYSSQGLMMERDKDDYFKYSQAKQEFRNSVQKCLSSSMCLDTTSSLADKAIQSAYGFGIFAPFSLSLDLRSEASSAANSWANSLSVVSLARSSYNIGKWTHPLRSELKYAVSHVSPLVLDLNGDGIKLFPYTRGVYFDIDNDGFMEKVGWASPEDGHLARDLNGNGVIDNITELFGDDLISAYFKLSLMDSNHDKIIDERDEDFEELLVWQDKNSNGFSEKDELKTLKQAGIKSISLETKKDDRIIEGNTITETSGFTYLDGRTGEVADVHYHNDDMDSWYRSESNQNNSFNDEVKERLSNFKTSLLKALHDKINNPTSINNDIDWIAALIKAQTVEAVDNYTQEYGQKSQQFLGKINEKFKYKTKEHAEICETKKEELKVDAIKSYEDRKKEATAVLLEELQSKCDLERDNIKSRYLQEENKEKDELLANANTQLKQINADARATINAKYDPQYAEILARYHKRVDDFVDPKNQAYKQQSAVYLESANAKLQQLNSASSQSLLTHFQATHGTQAQYDAAINSAREQNKATVQAEYNTNTSNLLATLQQQVDEYKVKCKQWYDSEKAEVQGQHSQELDNITTQNKANIEQDYLNKVKLLDEKYSAVTKKEIAEIVGKYAKEYKEQSEKIAEKLMQEESSKLSEKTHIQDQECSTEKDGLKKVLSKEYSVKHKQNEVSVQEFEQRLKHEALLIYKFFANNILKAVNDPNSAVLESLEDIAISYETYLTKNNQQIQEEKDISTTGIKIDPETLFLPLMRGYGNLPALHIAMTENSALKILVTELAGLKASEFNNLQAKIMTILYEWAGVSGIDEDARSAAGGANIEARKVAFVEQVTGQQFKQLGAAKFVGQHASTAVQKAWDIALVRTTKNLLVQGPLLPLFPKAEYSFADDTIKLNSSFNEIINSAKIFATNNELGYDFWVQLGYILAQSIVELDVSIEEINTKLSEFAGEPVMISIGTFELIGDDKDNIIKGTSGSDYIKGLGGNDKLYGRNGSDTLEGDEGDDELYGEDGIDRMHGGAGNDKMYGGNGRDFMYGDEGNDEIYGEEGDDHIEGGEGADTMDGGSGENTLSYGKSKTGVTVNLATKQASGGDAQGDKFTNFQNLGGSKFDDNFTGDDQDNYINGEDGNDEIHGGKGNDHLFGATGEDHLYGEEGDDHLSGYEGIDHMDGGEGKDKVSYHHPYATVGVEVNLMQGTGMGGHAQDDTYKNIENVDGSKFDDVITGDDNNNILNGMEGDDIIIGNDGDDIIIGSLGNNKLFGGKGNDKIFLGYGSDFADGGEGEDTISYEFSSSGVKLNMLKGKASVDLIHEDNFKGFENVVGSKFADEIIGDDKDNKLFGLDGDDIIMGGGGNDYILGDEGADLIDGGEGIDTVDYSNELKEAVIINLKKNIARGGFAEKDKLKNIENIVGTKFNDLITGDDKDNHLYGYDGDDIIRGGKGNDYLSGGNGKNELYGEEGNDQFEIGEGENKVYGGEGNNWVSYSNAKGSVTIDLSQKQGRKSTGEIDSFEDITNAIGSDYNDKIIGDDNANELHGGDGNDYIDGGAFSDKISGGKGNNTLIGGQGYDIFLVVEGSNKIDGGDDTDTINYSAYLKNIFHQFATQARFIKAAGAIAVIPYDIRFVSKPVIKYGEGPVISLEGLKIDLSAKEIIKPEGLIDTIISIESVIGTHYNDIITGDEGDNELSGLDGDDIIHGAGGNDKLFFGYGRSSLYGDAGNDLFSFRDSSDDYRNIVMAGVANINGGEGVDTVDFRTYPLAVQINLAEHQISYSADTIYALNSIEIVIATDFADKIHDSNGDDTIDSGAGDDIIYITDGNDSINSGDGNDTIYLSGSGEKRIWGEYGRDIYVVTSTFKSLKNTIILDFEAEQFGDRIDLTNLTNIKCLKDLKLTNITEQGLEFAIITISEGKEIALLNVEVSNLSEHNFIFYNPVVTTTGMYNDTFSL